MRSAREGQPYPLTLTFEVGGNTVRPTSSDIEVLIYDHQGSLLTTVQASADAPLVVVPAEIQTVTAGLTFEKRIVVWGFDTSSGWQTRREVYHILPMFPYSVTPQDVRAYIGVSASELPDTDIALDESFINLQQQIPSLLSDLTTGTVRELWANEALKLKTVIAVLPSMMQRVHQLEADGVLQVRRNTVKDFDYVLTAAKERLRALMADLAPVVMEVASGIPAFSVSRDRDAITGV